MSCRLISWVKMGKPLTLVVIYTCIVFILSPIYLQCVTYNSKPSWRFIWNVTSIWLLFHCLSKVLKLRSCRPSSVRAASSALDTLQRPTMHLLPQIHISATCLCVNLVSGAVWGRGPPPCPSLCEVTQRARSQHSQHLVWVNIPETSPPYVGLSA